MKQWPGERQRTPLLGGGRVSEPEAPPVAPGQSRRSPLPVPPALADLAAWTWRLLVLAAGAYALVRLLDLLYIVVLPGIGALLAAALAYPLVRFFRNQRMNRALATWLTVIITLAVVVGIFVLIVKRAAADYPELNHSLQQTVTGVQSFLHNDLHITSHALDNVGKRITNYLSQHSTSIVSSGVSIAATTGEALAALVLWFFITFFFLYDGDNIWNWIVGLVPPNGRERMRGAGDRAWARLAGFVRGTFIIAVFHGVVVFVALEIMRVPLALPLALLVFVGSFLPIVGAFIFGGIAVLVTFVTHGVIPGVVLIGILVIDNQVEAHLLQPFLVGRYVRLHPLAVAVAIAGGALLEGLYGAILAVPTVAVAYAVIRYLYIGDADGGVTGDADAIGGETVPPGEDDDAPPAEERLVPEAEDAEQAEQAERGERSRRRKPFET